MAVSLIAADANKQRSIPGSGWSKTRDLATDSPAVKEYLAMPASAADVARAKATAATASQSMPA